MRGLNINGSTLGSIFFTRLHVMCGELCAGFIARLASPWTGRGNIDRRYPLRITKLFFGTVSHGFVNG